MIRRLMLLLCLFTLIAVGGTRSEAQLKVCPTDSARVGTVCMDRYEGSVWQTNSVTLVSAITNGSVTLKQLLRSGAIQLGVNGDDYDIAGCPDTGNGCTNVYAVSIPGVTPSAYMTWPQAAAAARNSGKRLPTNAEWQVAALGTPDGAPCVVSASGPASTGTSGCVSDVGIHDMVGNVNEWTADWVPATTTVRGDSPFSWSGDETVLFVPSETTGPGVYLRGGWFTSGTSAGVFAITVPGINGWGAATGFRSVR